jgi:tripartite-type tricarboxylate transporter receptor subunit TctC
MTRGAIAQSKYPERPIRLVVPSASGGANDMLGRTWARHVEAPLGHVFIENQGGAGGMLGTAAVAHASPDGYTILLGTTGPQILIPVAASHPPYDPVQDFSPISILALAALSITVHPSVPAQTLNDLIEYAKANPGKLSYGSAGVGTMSHLTGELFKSLTGTSDIVHVPYGKGGGQMLIDLMSGHLSMVTLNISDRSLELHRAGRLRILAVTAPARIIAAPDIPTAEEQGLRGMIAQNFYGLFAPTGTPNAVIDQISDATRKAAANHDYREKLVASCFEPYLDSSPEAARGFVDEAVVRWTPVIKAIGLKLGSRRQGEISA